jgi:hypothetical protein
LPLAQNYIANASCRLTSNNLGDQDYEGWKAEGLAEEAKVWFSLFFASSAAPSSVVPGPP